jgi:hypothetical protein
MVRTAIALLLLAGLANGGIAQPRADLSHIDEAYRPFFGQYSADLDSARAALPFRRLRFTFGAGDLGPRFVVVLNREGTALLLDESDLVISDLENGLFEGEVSALQYGRLAALIDENDLFSMDRFYSNDWTHQDHYSIDVDTDSSTVSVEDWGYVGPIDLWAIEQAFWSVKASIFWTPMDDFKPADLQRHKKCVRAFGRICEY